MLVKNTILMQKIRFVGDVSTFIMNQKGEVYQEREHPANPDYIILDIVDRYTQETFQTIALKAGAKKKITPKKLVEKWSFSNVPDQINIDTKFLLNN